jgi:Ca2+-binding RTX toxin-like protein
MRALTFIVAVAMGLVLSVAFLDEAHGGEQTPNCATHAEYDNLHSLQYPSTVANIIGNDGWLVDSGPQRFIRGYRACWAPGERMVWVWYDQGSNFSYDKAIVDVQNGRVLNQGFARTVPFGDPGKPGGWDDRCWGKRVTIRGSYTADTITGTNGPDVIFAYAGSDSVSGGRGNDRICGRWGADLILSGGGGYDRVDGGGELDLLCFGEVTRNC